VPSSVEVRPFRRADRDQVAALVNAHVECVLPGVSLSVNAVLSQFEREADEYVVDPWAVERATLVALSQDRVVGTAYLVRYGDGPAVGDAYRDVAELRWLVHWPPERDAGERLMAECLATVARWGVARVHADGALPAPGIFGVPDCWPHVAALYERAGFVHDGRTEAILFAEVEDLPSTPTGAGRTMGALATRFESPAGHVELQTDLTAGGTRSRLAGWGEVWDERGDWPGEASEWLRVAGVRRLLNYAVDEVPGPPWRVLARTRRGWTLRMG
jgi:GNAT superfamily N-acetyltransferase